jgi:hypothetical protein
VTTDFNPIYPEDDNQLPQNINEEVDLVHINNNKSVDINKLLNNIVKRNIVNPLSKTSRRNRKIEKELYETFWNNLEYKEKIKLYELSLNREVDLVNLVFKTYNDITKNDMLKRILFQDVINPVSTNSGQSDKMKLLMEAVRLKILERDNNE